MRLFLLILFSAISGLLSAQYLANAGIDKFKCPGVMLTIGGSPTASGGSEPYSYTWMPNVGLNSNTIANPTVTATVSTTYTITVKDDRDSIRTDVVNITVDDVNFMNAGTDKDICQGHNTTVTLGASGNYSNPYSFVWKPGATLNDSTLDNPIATPLQTTTYTMSITTVNCGIISDQITITAHYLNISAGTDTIMNEGESITLHAQPYDSILQYYWYSDSNSTAYINYPTTYNPDVAPIKTRDFILVITDEYNCQYFDTVRVEVIPSDEPVFYNTLTPNGDGDNDVWIIGNLSKYRDNKLKIFNRYGQEVYSVNDYENNWNGKYLGQDLPGGTYFYVFDTKTDKGKYKGSITIFR